MLSSRSSLSFVILVAVVALSLTACGKSEPAPTPGGSGGAKAPAAGGAAPKTAKDAGKAAAPAPGADASGTTAQAPDTKAEPPSEGKAPPPTRDNLEAAYLQIYCMNKKGDAAKLLEVYKKYGFEDPKKWTEAWKEAAKDTEWVTRIHHQALKACPDPE